MPVPKPRKGEKHTQFIQRCMSDATMVKDFPDNSQRYAVCMSSKKEDMQNQLTVLKTMLEFIETELKNLD